MGSNQWIARMRRLIKAEHIPGLQVYLHARGIRNIRLSHGDDDLNLRLEGPQLATLEDLGDQVVERLRGIEGLHNVRHSNRNLTQELSIQVDRDRAAGYGLEVEEMGDLLRFALAGKVVTDLIADDRCIDIRLRLDRAEVGTPEDLADILLFSKTPPQILFDWGISPRSRSYPNPQLSSVTASNGWWRSPHPWAGIRI